MRRENSLKSSRISRNVILPFFLTHAGCESQCTFCDQHVIEGVPPDEESSFEDFSKRLSSYNVPPDEIAIYGGDIMNLPEYRITQILEKLQKRSEERLGYTPHLRVSASPRAVERKKLELMAGFNLRTVEVGVISTNEGVLNGVKRGYSPARAIQAVRLVINMGFNTGVQVITGLPGETVENFTHTLTDILPLSPHFARLYPLVILKGTRLAEDFKKNYFRPHKRRYIVHVTSLFILSCERWGVDIARVGLHDGEIKDDDVVFRSFTGNLRQKAEGTILALLVEYLLTKHKNIEKMRFHPKHETSFRGKKGKNFHRILTMFPQLSGRVMFDGDKERAVELERKGLIETVHLGNDDFFKFAFPRLTVQGEL